MLQVNKGCGDIVALLTQKSTLPRFLTLCEGATTRCIMLVSYTFMSAYMYHVLFVGIGWRTCSNETDRLVKYFDMLVEWTSKGVLIEIRLRFHTQHVYAHRCARRRHNGGGHGGGCARMPVGTHPHLLKVGVATPIVVKFLALQGARHGELATAIRGMCICRETYLKIACVH
jgi:hypothetical protein